MEVKRMSYEVWFKRGKERMLMDTFETRIDAESFADLEDMQMEADGEGFEIRESRRGSQ